MQESEVTDRRCYSTRFSATADGCVCLPVRCWPATAGLDTRFNYEGLPGIEGFWFLNQIISTHLISKHYYRLDSNYTSLYTYCISLIVLSSFNPSIHPKIRHKYNMHTNKARNSELIIYKYCSGTVIHFCFQASILSLLSHPFTPDFLLLQR